MVRDDEHWPPVSWIRAVSLKGLVVVAHQCGVFAGEGLGRQVGAVAVTADCDSDIFHVYRLVGEEPGSTYEYESRALGLGRRIPPMMNRAVRLLQRFLIDPD